MATICLLLTTVCFGQTAPATAPAAARVRPTVAVAPAACMNGGCHAEVKAYKAVHGPVNVGACDACHKPADVKEHKFTYPRGKAEMCTFCHQLDAPKLPVVHKPLAEGQCMECHNPHGGTDKRFFRGTSMSDMCNRCHKDVMKDKKAVHGPVAAGACGACHGGHAAKHKKLLHAEGKELCLSCHTDMKAQMAAAKVKHKAVEQDCSSCHDAHGSNYAMMVKQAPLQLCTGCHEHEKIKQAAMAAPNKHSIVTADQACLNCHTAHGGSLAHLMRTEPIKTCMKCHDKKQEAGGGRTVAAVSEVLDPKLHKHGSIRDGQCAGCHAVHGSANPKLLAKPYPKTFYAPFSMENYELCFSCHDKQLVQQEQTEGLTGFRNGKQNLHFVHVNREKGRTCRACHESHASPQPVHLRDAVPYGQWMMPINFKKTATGGSCAPGCHKEYSYERGK